jgi:hypothetical protein
MITVPVPTADEIKRNVARFRSLRERFRAMMGSDDAFLDAMEDCIKLGWIVLEDDDVTFTLTERGAEQREWAKPQ